VIAFDRVSLEYQPERFALQDVSFSLEPGSFTYLTGHSGAGKSSLLKLIARLERPTTGEIYAGNIRYGQLRERQVPALRRQMGLIFQDNQLLNDRSVFDNVAFPLIIGGYKFADIEKRVNAALRKVGLSDKAADEPFSLSGGQQQRVGIARAVVARPKILLADEPTGNLDSEISAEIMQLLMQFNASGVTVLLATHDEGLLNTFNFPRLILKQGHLVQSDDQRRTVIEGGPVRRSSATSHRRNKDSV
jgi:cell division transport system ATP-binding protein